MRNATSSHAVQDAPSGGVYLDSSALAKLYVPEPESDRLEAFLRGRRDLLISELTLTEILSAAARRRREGALSPYQANEIREALLADADSGSFQRLSLDPVVHRVAERLLFALESLPLRTLDALHIAVALCASATYIATYDARMREAATRAGLRVIEV